MRVPTCIVRCSGPQNRKKSRSRFFLPSQAYFLAFLEGLLTLVPTQPVRQGGVLQSLWDTHKRRASSLFCPAFRGRRRVSREALPASVRRMPGRPPAPLPCPVPSPPATWRWLRASRSTLALAWLAWHTGRLPLQIPQAWRAAMVGELRRCAASIATSLPTVNSLGGAHERSRYPRRGRAVHFSGGCASGTFRCWLPSHRSAAALRADAVLEAARGQDDVLATLGAWRAAVLRAGGAQRSRSGSSQADG